MEKFLTSTKRQMYVSGKRMMAFPFHMYILPCLGFSTVGVAVIASLIQGIKLSYFSDIGYILLILRYALLTIIASLILAIIVWILIRLLSFIFIKTGSPAKLDLSPFNNSEKNRVEIKIFNNENEDFEGEFRILKINDNPLSNPLIMGIGRGEGFNQKVCIPKNEPDSVVIGMYDKIENYAYFVDAYGEKRKLPPETRIYTRLSGKLSKSGEEIFKESQWYINYKIYHGAKTFSLSNLIEIEEQKIGFGKFDIIAEMKAFKRKR